MSTGKTQKIVECLTFNVLRVVDLKFSLCDHLRGAAGCWDHECECLCVMERAIPGCSCLLFSSLCGCGWFLSSITCCSAWRTHTHTQHPHIGCQCVRLHHVTWSHRASPGLGAAAESKMPNVQWCRVDATLLLSRPAVWHLLRAGDE